MKTKQCEHLMLTEEQIKDHICDLTVELHQFKNELDEIKDMLEDQIENMEKRLYLLKRHFCPEKFQEMQISMSTLSEMMEKAYFHNTGATQRHFKNEENNGVAETE